MSRWKWTQPLGTPVVPLVKAISAGSSPAVSTGGSGSSAGGARLQLALAIVAVIFDDLLDEMGLARSASRKSPMKRLSTMAWLISARSMTVAISPGRSKGMVVTTTPPALSTPSQQANKV